MLKQDTQSKLVSMVLAALWTAAAVVMFTGCAAAPRAPMAEMAPMPVQEEAMPAAPQALSDNHFRTDRTTNLTEGQLKEILNAPVFLDDRARVGIVPVATAYEVDPDLPLALAPQRLSEALEALGVSVGGQKKEEIADMLFNAIDVDGSGTVEVGELRKAIKKQKAAASGMQKAHEVRDE